MNRFSSSPSSRKSIAREMISSSAVVSRPFEYGKRPKPTSCRIVSRVMKWFSWRRMETIFARSFDFVEATSYPAISIAPESMSSRRPIIVSSVDLPAPLGPTRAVTPPAGIVTSTGPICTVSL
ncbi:Uncharacterised protein [Mycobacteroides abscessus subsp. abscessus]|nr:Uncharacterised protein [Mycobacteroides abscessus subsp. abscessus]